MDVMSLLAQLKLPAFKLPMAATARGKPGGPALVIRTATVELVAMSGAKELTHTRVPIEGEGPEALTQAIAKVLGQADLKSKRLIVSLSTPDILIRFFSMPALPRSECDVAVQFEVRKYIPFKTESLNWDYYIIPSAGGKKVSGGSGADQPQQEVVFGGVPRDVLRKFQEALTAAGAQPAAVEPLSVSLARLTLPVKGVVSEEFMCLVDVERDRAHLVIAKNGIPYLTRNVNLPAGEPAPAETAAPEAGTGSQAQQLLSELRVSMDFFMREYPSARITSVVLFGDEPRIEPWYREMSGQLPCGIELGRRLLEGRTESECPLSFAAAVGLSQRGSTRGGAALDFLARGGADVKPKAAARGVATNMNVNVAELLASLKDPKALIGTGLGCALVLAGLWALAAQQVSSAERQLAQIVASRPVIGMGLDGKGAAALQPVMTDATQQQTLLQQIIGKRSGAAVKFDALVRAIPDGIWFNQLTFEDRMDPATGLGQMRMNITGSCFLGGKGEDEVSAIQEFEDRVKRNPVLFNGTGFAQVDSISAQAVPRQSSTYRTFQLNCQSGRRL